MHTSTPATGHPHGATPAVKGLTVDDQTRCEHYASPVDVIAIKFYCCGTYYPCYRCHEACADHPIQRWPADRFDQLAVLCGVCKQEMTIATYLEATACPHCGAPFNPACRTHHAHYFEIR